MYAFLTILIILVSIFIMLIVLAQSPKGNGMAAGFGGSQASNLLGSHRAGDLLEKITWGSAIALLFLSLLTTFFIDKTGGQTTKTKAEEVVNETFVPGENRNAVPVVPDMEGQE